MNKLILIGNGFDLAHGLKTKYSDFILWYLNKSMENLRVSPSGLYTDRLITLNMERPRARFNTVRFSSIQEFFSFRDLYRITVEYGDPFIDSIILYGSLYNWVDIEAKYYEALVEIFKRHEKAVNKNKNFMDLKRLNSSFDLLKNELSIYLQTIDNSLATTNNEISEHLQKVLHEISRLNGNNPRFEALFLNFNYTSTLDQYLPLNSKWPARIINIHGKLNDKLNPIIFGYGDEIDLYYEQMERLNENGFLDNIKSFSYFKTKNYQNFSEFVNRSNFEVLIMGHSCGLSDRILLNSIFESDNCNGIKIYYHQKNPDEDDYFEKTQQISRHFKAINKGKMRTRVIPFPSSSPLIKYKAKEE